MQAGASLGEVTDELRRDLGVATRILPMSDDPCPTIVELGGGRRIHFEEYLVRDGAPADVEGVDLSAAAAAAPASGVLDAIAGADLIAVCPSNPVVSIGPILAVEQIRSAIAASAAPVVGISPIVGGAPIKGPADSLLRAIGVEVSARGVAAHYRDWIDAIVIDDRDAELAAPIRELGLGVAVCDTIMTHRERATELARTLLTLAERLR
jgi:LPPG:FO 2-phospho-L-lactate transferase